MRWAALVSLLALSSARPIAAQTQVDHMAWDLLLKRHVASGLVPPPGTAAKGGSAHSAGPFGPATGGGMVDYEGFRQDRAALDRYVVSLQDVQPSQLGSREVQLAFWINAYNANVVKGVLDHYPIASVKNVKGFFDRIRYRVAGRELTLNEIEGEGRALGDWRIHFAVVCAAIGCPVLRSEAYAPERVSVQLDEQISRYLVDDVHGMRIDYASKTLWVSKIFKWYAKDFVPAGPLTAKSLWAVIGGFVPQDKPLLPVPEQFSLKFLDYDWSLNVQRR